MTLRLSTSCRKWRAPQRGTPGPSGATSHHRGGLGGTILAFVSTSLAALAFAESAPRAEAAAPVDAQGQAIQRMDAQRIVSIGGAVTEIVYALGAASSVVGIDSSSVYPEATAQLPNVGYLRTVSAEGMIALQPSLVITTTEMGPPAALEQLRAAGIPVLALDAAPNVGAARARIRGVARALGREADGERLLSRLDQDLATAQARVGQRRTTPRVLFLYARGGGTLLVSGSATAAAEMLALAGATNAIADFQGFKPLTAEAAVAAAPEVILIPTRGANSLGGTQAVWALPGLELTPAGRSRRLVQMDDLYLLGFGPRLGQAVADLANGLHPELQRADATDQEKPSVR